MKNTEKANKQKKFNKGILKYISLKTLLILLVFLIFNGYAWFIYVTKVSTSITVHVNSWDIEFTANGNTSTTDLTLNVATIKPGMTNYVQTVDVTNNGETDATLSYSYKSVTIFGTLYDISTGYTPTQLKQMMETDNPFKVSVTYTNTNVTTTNNGQYTITISWPFESGNDTLDTQWGEQAYDFLTANPGADCLIIVLELIASQAN